MNVFLDLVPDISMNCFNFFWFQVRFLLKVEDQMKRSRIWRSFDEMITMAKAVMSYSVKWQIGLTPDILWFSREFERFRKTNK